MTDYARFAGKILKFLIAGLPAFVVALATNYLLVSKYDWPKPIAYLIVMWLQMTINFYACRHLVFEVGKHSSIVRQYGQFLSGFATIRVAEWLFYTVLVEMFYMHYIAVQVVSILVFAIVKFRFSESLFEHPQRPIPDAVSDSAKVP